MLIEPASSITDFALGTAALGAAFGLGRRGDVYTHWRWTFIFIGIAGLMGGVRHGFIDPANPISKVSWSTITMVIAVAISFLLAATAATVLGKDRGRVLLGVRIVSVVALLILAILGRATIQTLLFTEGLAMILVLLLWAHSWHIRQPGAGLFLLAITASILAGGVRGTPLHVTFAGWDFDPNALYHMAQMPGILLLYIAVRRRFQDQESPASVRQPILSPIGGT